MAKGKAQIDEEKVTELYNKGLGYQKIAKILDCSEWAVRIYIQESGIKSASYTRCSAEMAEEIRRLYLDEGKKIREVAEIMGLSFEAVKSILVRKGICRSKCPQRGKRYDVSAVKLNTVDDPIYYIERQPTNEIVTIGKKRYKDVSAIYLGG